jgi:uncharacterized protein YbjT (DUF2867 family)
VNVLVFGATGMVGQGVLRECLLDPDVGRVLVVGRHSIGQPHPKLREALLPDLFDLSSIQDQLTGFDACFDCLGVSSAGMNEANYRRVTYDLTLSIARTLAARNPAMTFIYVTGAGTDSSERGRVMWARVKGATENALLQLPFVRAVMFRPGYIQPLHGITSSTAWYRAAYAILSWLYPLLVRVAPKWVTTTEQIGKGMLAVAKRGAPKAVLETTDINALTLS